MINDKNTRKKDPLGLLDDTQVKPVAKSDPLGLFGDPEQVETPVENALLDSVKTEMDKLAERPPLKFNVAEAGSSGVGNQIPRSDLLNQADKELGLDNPVPFPELKGSAFNQYPIKMLNEATTSSLATDAPDVQGEFNVKDAQKRMGQIIDGYDEEPIETRRRTVQFIAEEYEGIIEGYEKSGNEKRAAKLRDELSNIRQLEGVLIGEESARFNQNTTLLQRTGWQLKRGSVGLAIAMNGRAISDNKVLDLYNRIDETGEVTVTGLADDDKSQFAGAGLFAMGNEYLKASPEERQQLKAVRLEKLAKDIADIKELRRTIQSIPMDPIAEKFLNAKSFGDVFDMFLEAPFQVATEVAFANLPQMSISMVGAIAGAPAGPAGVAAGAGTGSAIVEYGNLILEELEREGVDLDNEEELAKAVQDTELMKKVKANARTGAAIVGVLDGASFALAATRFIPKGTIDDIAGFIGREALDESIQVVGQGSLGASGAGLSEFARTGEVTGVGEMGAELVGEGAMAPFKAFGIRSSIRRMHHNRAAHSILEYVTLEDILTKIDSERQRAVQDNDSEAIAKADKLKAEVKANRSEMVNNQRDRLNDYLAEVEKKIRTEERKRGAKAFGKQEFKSLLAQRDALRKMLSETENPQQTTQEQTNEGQKKTTQTGTETTERTQENDDAQDQATDNANEENQDQAGQEDGQGGGVLERDTTEPGADSIEIPELNENNAHEVYAASQGIDPSSLDELGSGEFGTAYSTRDGRVVKVTTSASEAALAKERMGKKSDTTAEVYDVKRVGDEFIIFQEELEIDSEIEDTMPIAEEILQEQGLSLPEAYMFDPDEVSDDLRSQYEEIEDFVLSLSDISQEYTRLGVMAQDIQADNLGYDSEGNLKAFDLDDKGRDLEASDVDVEDFSPQSQQEATRPEPQETPLQERLARTEQEIERFEALENPTDADNDYLMFLRDEQEQLQTRVQQRQEEAQAAQEEADVAPFLYEQEQIERLSEVGAESAREINSLVEQAWNDPDKPIKRNAGDYYVRVNDSVVNVYQNSDGKWYFNYAGARNSGSNLGGVSTRKEAISQAEGFDRAYNEKPEARRASNALNEKGMKEAGTEVVERETGSETTHEAMQLDDNTYRYRDFTISKTSNGDFNVLSDGKKVDTVASLEDAKAKADAIIDGQVDSETGDALGEAVLPSDLRGAELPKSGLMPANRQDGKVYVGGLLSSHATIMDTHGLDPEVLESGFITSDGRYLTRAEAKEFVQAQKIATREGPPGTLLSEQLIPEKKKVGNTTNVPKGYKQDKNVRQEESNKVKSKVTPDTNNYGNANKLVTKEQADNIRAELAKAAGQLNMGIDPKVLKLSAQLATYHIEAGVRSFSDFAKVMINEVGEQVVPRLRALYNDAIKSANIEDAEFSEKAEIDRFFLEYYRNPDQEILGIDDAKTFVGKTAELVDKEIKSQIQYQALSELAKAYINESTEVNSVLDFIDQVKKDFPGVFSTGQISAGWSAALSNVDDRQRHWISATIAQQTGIPAKVSAFYHYAGIRMRKALQDYFIGQKQIQRNIEKKRGADYFMENEDLDAYMYEDLIRGRVSALQFATTDMTNANSDIRRILQIAKENGVEIGSWNDFYKKLKMADRYRSVGMEEQALALEKEALENDPNQNDEFQRYLHAKHAEEANNFLVEQIQEKINAYELQLEQIPDEPDNKQARANIKAQITRLKNQIPEAERGSGMKNKDAADILDAFDAQGKTAALQQMAEIVYDINNRMLEMRRENGMNSEEEIDTYQTRFQYYVPLNRLMYDPYGNLLEQVGKSTTGGRDGAAGTKFKRRTGSDRPVDNILGTVMMNFDQLIGDVEKNNIVVTLAKLYDSEWAMGNETLGRSVKAGTADDVQAAEKMPFRVKLPDGTVEDRVLIFNTGAKLVYDALAKFDSKRSDTFLKGAVNTLRSFMNYLRFVRTSASMNFIVSNPQRDIGTVMGNMASDFGYGASLKFTKDMFHTNGRFVDAQRSVWEYLQGLDTPGAQEYQKLRELGGTTGFYQLRDRADIMKDLRRVEKELTNGVMRSGQPVRNSGKYVTNHFKKMIRGLEMVNEVAENATRLNAYRSALENGYSEKRAAQYALNVNTNFNKSGDWGALFKIGYQFANSAIQGHTRMLRAAKVNPQTFFQTTLSLMALGAANSSFNDWMNEEAHARLKRTRPWLFNNNLVFLGPSGNVMFKIYLPFGYNVFKAAGDITYDLSNGTIEAQDAAARFGDAMADSFNPFRGSEMFTGGVQGLMLAATPSALDPVTEIGLNKSFFGNIYPPFREALQETMDIQDFQLKYDSVNPYMEYVTNFLAKHDVADISPETIEHLTYFLGGSVGREWINLFSKSINTDEAQREGLTLYTREDGTDVKIMPNNIPIVSRFLNTVDKDRIAASSIYQTTVELSTESFNVQSEEFYEVLQSLSSDYEIILENEAASESTKETMFKTMNAFSKTVFKNTMRDEAIRYFRDNNLTGPDNEAARQQYYSRINSRVRSFRVPMLEDVNSTTFRLKPFGTKRSKIYSENIIEQIEVKVN